ncbi:MAG: Gfo/Idh/MocA family oxidoreductase [Acidobacteriia bacterium]|nr:Gfo/Idh/MocA family oxidoreductase [Terriglobia bacterium]
MFSNSADRATNRRRFLEATVVTAASYGRVWGANSRIRIGAIGTGSRGQYLVGNAGRIEGAEVVAVCDVYAPHRAKAKAGLAGEVREYLDHREVLDRQDIDAVIIGTPDHWHVPITIDAVRAGKDVYCEKPVTHTLAEEAPLLAAVRESKRVVQTGTQQRSWQHYMHASELIGSGALGQVTLIRTYWFQNHIANQSGGPEIDLEKLDWKRFLGSNTNRPFDADQYAHWRWYWDFGGGAMTDLFIHWVDVAQWFLEDDQPKRATASGVKALLQQRQTPDTMSAALTYAKAIVEFDCTLLGYIEGGGMMIRGTKGAMRLHRSGFEIYDEIPTYSEGFSMPEPTHKQKSRQDGGMDHMQNFLDCVRSRKTPTAPVEVGIAAAHAGHVANLAMRGNGVWTPS